MNGGNEADNGDLRFPEHALALYQALKDDAFYLALGAAAVGDSAGALQRYLDYSMLEAQCYGELLFPEDRTSGVAVWLKPLTAKQEARKKAEKRSFLLAELGEEALELYTAVVDAMALNATGRIAEDAWYLSILGVSPRAQGRGIGADLLGRCLARTDDLGVATYLETFTPRNEPFYERLGYRSAGAFREPALAAGYRLLVRAAR